MFEVSEMAQPDCVTNPGSIKIVAKMPVAEENLEKFKALAAELVEKSRQEPGNIFYSLNVHKKDPCLLTFIECWKDKDAIKSHNASEHFTRIFPQLSALCTAQPTAEMFVEVV